MLTHLKTVGKQLQDARLAKGWSPELAARETKIRVDRLHDLEEDDYSHFSSPTYARGFVRTYARSLGIDEYKILRQLDNKLPEDDNATFVNDGGVPYMPEPSKVTKPFEVGRGVYIAAGIGAAMLLLIGFILLQVYRAGYFAQAIPVAIPAGATNNTLPFVPDSETAARALPADSNAPPVPLPVDLSSTAGAAPAAVPASAAPPTPSSGPLRALPVDPAALTGVPPATTAWGETQPAMDTHLAATAPAIDAATVPLDTKTPPRAQAVDLNAVDPSSGTTPNVPSPNPSSAEVAPTAAQETPPAASLSARQSDARRADPASVAAPSTPADAAPPASMAPGTPTDAVAGSGPEVAANNPPAQTPPAITTQTPSSAPQPSAAPAPAESPAVDTAPSSLVPDHSEPTPPAAEAAPVTHAAAPDSTSALTGAPAPADPTTPPAASNASKDPGVKSGGKHLVLIASHDSFIRVIALDGPEAGQVRYASVLHGGQSISFSGRKYSINVENPSAVEIALDGINYGPHSDHSEPETFSVESHQP